MFFVLVFWLNLQFRYGYILLHPQIKGLISPKKLLNMSWNIPKHTKLIIKIPSTMRTYGLSWILPLEMGGSCNFPVNPRRGSIGNAMTWPGTRLAMGATSYREADFSGDWRFKQQKWEVWPFGSPTVDGCEILHQLIDGFIPLFVGF